MSRLKRQRLTVSGQDRVTSAADDVGIDGGEEESHSVGWGQQNPQQNRRSLFVRSLPLNATSESLTNFFSQSFPLKHATVVVDPESKQSKGYGFVTFTDAEDAQSAKDAFNGSLFEGRQIKVELAEPRHRQENAGGLTDAGTAKARPDPQKSTFQNPSKLIVRNLPWTIKEPEQLAVLFRSYGKVKHATLPKTSRGRSAGFGFVILRGRKNAERAMGAVNGKIVNGRTLAVDWAVDKETWDVIQLETKNTAIRDRDVDAPAHGRDTESVESENSYQVAGDDDPPNLPRGSTSSDRENSQATTSENKEFHEASVTRSADSSNSTLFIRNLPFSSTDESLRAHFESFGPVRYARVVLDHTTERPKGTAFVCYRNLEDANSCLRGAPGMQSTSGRMSTAANSASRSSTKQSLLQDTSLDPSGRYTVEGRVLQISRAVDRIEATRLTSASSLMRDARDKDRRRLYLLSEGTVPSNSPLYNRLSPYEIKMREDSAKQRQSLIRRNAMLHFSLTRLSIRNLPRSITSKDLKALAREAVVGFAQDVKNGLRKQLSKEELWRGGEEMKQAEKARKARGKGIVKQAKIVFEGREGSKVSEDSGAGRSRGYGFVEYSSHRWALMGLRWLNGHALEPARTADDPNNEERRKRLITEFAIENAQVVGRRQERETRARERSRLVSEKLDRGEKLNVLSRPLTRGQSMANVRKGMKRKRISSSSALPQDSTSNGPNANGTNHDPGKLAKRQQIIGRKRMMRRAKTQPV